MNHRERIEATIAREKKPATTAALEKYLGSGLIKGVGPKTAKKIVRHFRDQTLDVFEGEIHRLVEVPGIDVQPKVAQSYRQYPAGGAAARLMEDSSRPPTALSYYAAPGHFQASDNF